MELSIFQAEKENASDLAKLLNIVTDDLHQKSIFQWEYPWKLAEIENDIIRNKVFLLLDDGKIIGTYGLKTLDSNPWVSENDLKSQYLYRIAIHPEYQRKGIGVKLINHALGLSKQYHLDIYLDCWAGNRKLKAFYSSMGFRYVGDFPENDYQISVYIFPYAAR